MLDFLKSFVRGFRLMDFHSNRAEFYEDMAKSYEKNELFPDFLEAELEIVRSKGTSNSSKAFALSQTLRAIREGEDMALTKTLAKVMPQGDAMLLIAVDQAATDQKADTLRNLATQIREQAEAKKIVLKALLTPVLVIPGVAFFSYIMSAKSLPIIVKIAPPETWTPFNQSVRSFADFVNNYGSIVLASFFIGAIALGAALPRWRSSIRFKMEQVSPKLSVWLTPVAPWLLPLSMYRDFQAGLLLGALSVLLKNKQLITQALETIYGEASPYMRHHIRLILDHLDEHPAQYAQAFSRGLLSPRLMARLATLVRTTPQFENVVIEVGTVGSAEIREQVRKTALKLNGMFLALAAGLVFYLYIGQINITQTMREEMEPQKRQQRMDEQRRARGGMNMTN